MLAATRCVDAHTHVQRPDRFIPRLQLLVLSAGKTAYFGPANSSIEHFAASGYICPPRTNPAEFILDLVTGMDIGDQKAADLPRIFQESGECGL